MALSNPRFLSVPHEVYFCGFRSTTYLLQQAGWQLSADQDYASQRIRLAMHNKGFGGYMLADELGHNFHRHDEHTRLVFQVRQVNADVLVYHTSFDLSFDKFEPIDARPQYVTNERKSIKDFNIFASQLVRTEEIIIEPQSVAECLDLIRKMQAPELQAVRQRNATRDFIEATNQTKFHAQVMSLAA